MPTLGAGSMIRLGYVIFDTVKKKFESVELNLGTVTSYKDNYKSKYFRYT